MQHGDDDRVEQLREPLYLPTPEEIEAACLEFQRGWSEEMERTRKFFRIPGLAAAGVEQRAVAAADDRLAKRRSAMR